MIGPISAEDEVYERVDEQWQAKHERGDDMLRGGEQDRFRHTAESELLFAALQRIDILEVRLRALEGRVTAQLSTATYIEPKSVSPKESI